MDFFHCNSCFSQPGPPKNLKFCLTSCGHTFCTDCLSLSSSKCKECQSVCRILPLTKDIPSNLQLYFTDLIKEAKKVIKILLIQNKHYSIYMEEYIPHLVSNYIATKNLLDKKNSEVEILKKRSELLMTENDQLKREIILLKKKFPEKETPIRNSRDIYLCENKNFGSRPKSVDKFTFKSSSSKPPGFFTSSPSDSLLNQAQPMTSTASLIRTSALRDNMRMLKPPTPGTRVNQSFSMASKSPIFTSKRLEVCSPGSWCSSVSSIKSPFTFEKKPYFQKS